MNRKQSIGANEALRTETIAKRNVTLNQRPGHHEKRHRDHQARNRDCNTRLEILLSKNSFWELDGRH